MHWALIAVLVARHPCLADGVRRATSLVPTPKRIDDHRVPVASGNGEGTSTLSRNRAGVCDILARLVYPPDRRGETMAKKGEIWTLDGREVRVTNLDKVFWPEQGYTKGDLLRYYRDVAATLLPYMQDRPFTMRVWPDGITGKNFYRWRVPNHAPDWLERYIYQLQTADKTAEMAVVDDPPELIWVVNQGVIEMHPWFATRHDPDRPTWMLFDLDPVAGLPFERVLQVALWVREMLEETGLSGAPKTSGKKGIHVFVPIERRHTFEEVRGWLGAFIGRLEEAHPDAVTGDKSLAERGAKVLIDSSQNARGKSIAAPYSVRAVPGAPVSAPLTWDEVSAGRVRPSDFTMMTMPARLAERGDLFAEVLRHRQRLPDFGNGEDRNVMRDA